ncbi:MAG: ferritin-like domain-containing protein [Solirubrobacterales bacterium]|nr:ferritin-like domain-containing protein [Solirubrobacterales bacterium]
MVKGALPRIQSSDEGRGRLMARVSRGSLLKGSVAAVGALAGIAVGGAELAASAESGGSAATDHEILTFGLLIERLQAAFYAAALRGGKLTGEARQFAQVLGAEELAHVKYVSAALGPSAGTSPRFRFGDAVTDPAKFIATAISLEEAGLGVYNGQAVNLTPMTLAAAARIVSVEARHAAWARALAGEDPAPVAVDVPVTLTQAKQTFQPFIVQ